MTFGLEPEMSSYGAAPELRKNHKLWQKTYELTKNLSKVVKTVDFGVLVPIDINPDNKIISPPTRPLFSVTITYLTNHNCFISQLRNPTIGIIRSFSRRI